MQGIDDIFLPWIIKALKPEMQGKCNNDFRYMQSFRATHSPKDHLTDEPFTCPLITESPDGNGTMLYLHKARKNNIGSNGDHLPPWQTGNSRPDTGQLA